MSRGNENNNIWMSFLYTRLKNGTHVLCYGVWRPGVNFFVSSEILIQFTSDQAETWCIVSPLCGAVYIVWSYSPPNACRVMPL